MASAPIVQPVSIVYDRLNGLPMGRSSRPVCAWYGDMELGSHFWRLARYRGMRATILLHAPVDPAAYESRKALSRVVWQTVADGAAALRQNRPAQPRALETLDPGRRFCLTRRRQTGREWAVADPMVDSAR